MLKTQEIGFDLIRAKNVSSENNFKKLLGTRQVNLFGFAEPYYESLFAEG
jgi:hypothetical protein